MACGTLAAPASAASAFTVHVVPSNTFGLLLDVSGASQSPGAPVIDWFANGGANQAWTFSPVGGYNDYEIFNQNSGQCLTTDGVAGDQVYQLPCSGDAVQLWNTQLTPSSTTAHSIRSVYSGLYLDVNGNNSWPGASLDTWYANGGPNQFFSPV